MIPLLDAVLVLVLLGVAAALPPGALVSAAWLALVTPLLVRSDRATRRLPNWATVPALALVVAIGVVSQFVETGVEDPTRALLLTLIVAAIGFLSATFRLIGLGDVKLAAAVAGSASLACPDAALVVLLVTAIAGGVAVLGRCLGEGRRGGADIGAESALRLDGLADHRGIAYGPCLLLGYWVAVLSAVAS